MESDAREKDDGGGGERPAIRVIAMGGGGGGGSLKSPLYIIHGTLFTGKLGQGSPSPTL